MKLENHENFFTLEGGCDRKCRLLRSNVKLTDREVERIDSGELSIEDLEALVARKAKVFKYGTQITIHAGFPREVAGRVNGYAYLVNNRNGSVGVRYGAIDEAKRRHIYRYLCYEGFRYDKNSSRHGFVLSKSFTGKAGAMEYIAALKTMYDYDALRRLISGSIDIYGGVWWGMYYVMLDITVNAIPADSIPEFLRLMRCKREEEIAVIEEEKRRREEERELLYRQERQARLAGEAQEAQTRRQQALVRMQEKHAPISRLPAGDCSLCLVTGKGALVVVKRFTLKNGRTVTKKFLQRDSLSMKDYQRWNNTVPAHSAKDTYRLEDAALERYIGEGSVFSL